MSHPTLIFEDIQSISHSIDCKKQGIDPYVHDCDPWGRLLNYPPIWLGSGALGVNSGTIGVVGSIFAMLMAFAAVLILPARSLLGGVLVFATVTARPVLLAVERGNTDLLVFFLLATVLWFGSTLPVPRRTLLFGLLIVLLATLKIYPIAAAVILLRDRRSLPAFFACVIGSLLALLLETQGKLGALLARTPQSTEGSFGSYPFFVDLSHVLIPSAEPLLAAQHQLTSLLAVVLFVVAAAVGIVRRADLEQRLPRLDFDHPPALVALACTAIFCCAFVAGANFNYRLIFLLGIVGFLITSVSTANWRRAWPMLAIFFLLLALPGRLVVLRELLDGAAFVLAGAWLACTLYRSLVSGTGGSAHPAMPSSFTRNP